MTELSNIESELQKFGLTKNQAIIYMLLVKHKELRIQEIVRLTKIPRSSVYENLRSLFELGIAEEIIEENFKLIRPYSIGVMHHGLDEKMLEVRRLKKDLSELEKSISLASSIEPYGSAQVRYYKGRSGARQLYWNTLKAKDTVYVMSDWGRGRYVGMKFYESFVAESRNRQVQERVLINPTPAALESIREFTYPGSPISRTRLEDIRAIDERKVKIIGDVLIYNNIYATIYLKQVSINGFEIESQQFAGTQRAIFEVLWQSAKPVAELL